MPVSGNDRPRGKPLACREGVHFPTVNQASDRIGRDNDWRALHKWRMDDTLPLTPAAQIVAGLLILILGRRLFWIFVGVVGFFFGLQYGMSFFSGIADWMLLLLSLVTGLVCAALTIVLQRLAVALAGGFAGGLLAFKLAPFVGLHTQEGQWVAFIAGGLLAAALISALFDPALIFLSAATGALMITGALPLDEMVVPLLFGILFIVGVAVQLRIGSGRVRAA